MLFVIIIVDPYTLVNVILGVESNIGQLNKCVPNWLYRPELNSFLC